MPDVAETAATVGAKCRDCGAAFQRPVRGRPRVLCYTCKPRDRRGVGKAPTGAVTPPDVATVQRPAVMALDLRQVDEPATSYPQREEPADSLGPGVMVTEMTPQYPGPLGCTTPRLFTPPLRELTPSTTLGFAFIEFCHEVLCEPLLPWQAWLAVHAFELAPGCTTEDAVWRYRFKVILVIVARQNGKSDISRKVKLFKMYVLGMKLIIGTAQDLDIARMMLAKTNEMIDKCPALAGDKISHTVANGKEKLTLTHNREYVIKAPNGKAGRGPSADHVDMDELREHRDRAAWNALRPTIRAVPKGQLWGFSNAGDDNSVLLNDLQEKATLVIEQGTGDEDSLQTFMAEYSAPEGCELRDVDAIRQSNPALGYLFDINEIWSSLENDTPEGFRTEVLCQRVASLTGAFDMSGWEGGIDPGGSLASSRDRIAFGIDVSLDGLHVTASIATGLPDGRYRVEPVGAWESTHAVRKALPDIVARLQPRVIRWFKNGPAAAIGAELRALADEDVDVDEITGSEVTETCMEFVDLVRYRSVLHPNDRLFNAQVENAGKKVVGDGFVIVRNGKSHVDAVYSMAAAVHGARNLPAEIDDVEPLLIAAW